MHSIQPSASDLRQFSSVKDPKHLPLVSIFFLPSHTKHFVISSASWYKQLATELPLMHLVNYLLSVGSPDAATSTVSYASM